jgi:hypothetical protein
MYRLNGLLIADQIRASVAAEMRLGRAALPPLRPESATDSGGEGDSSPVETWPPLNFGKKINRILVIFLKFLKYKGEATDIYYIRCYLGKNRENFEKRN